MPDRQSRALIASGDSPARLGLSRHLLSEGFHITECTSGLQALERVTSSQFDLIVLDDVLDGLDGIALCRVTRQGSANAHAALFIISTSATESNKVLAFVNGADDYITKPFGIREFLARVSAVMRRAQRAGANRCAQTRVEQGELSVDPSKRQVIVRGRAVACSKQEFDLLYVLASSPGVVFSREELLASAFAASPGPPDNPAAPIRLVDPIVSRLRRKIEREPHAPRMIVTVWGVGYKFAE